MRVGYRESIESRLLPLHSTVAHGGTVRRPIVAPGRLQASCDRRMEQVAAALSAIAELDFPGNDSSASSSDDPVSPGNVDGHAIKLYNPASCHSVREVMPPDLRPSHRTYGVFYCPQACICLTSVVYPSLSIPQPQSLKPNPSTPIPQPQSLPHINPSTPRSLNPPEANE